LPHGPPAAATERGVVVDRMPFPGFGRRRRRAGLASATDSNRDGDRQTRSRAPPRSCSRSRGSSARSKNAGSTRSSTGRKPRGWATTTSTRGARHVLRGEPSQVELAPKGAAVSPSGETARQRSGRRRSRPWGEIAGPDAKSRFAANFDWKGTLDPDGGSRACGAAEGRSGGWRGAAGRRVMAGIASGGSGRPGARRRRTGKAVTPVSMVG